MILTNEQADKIYAAFGLNAAAVKQAALKVSEEYPTLDSQESHVLAMFLGGFMGQKDTELADCAYEAFGRLQEMVRVEGNPPTHQEGGV
jgi:hypothetical protein